MSEPSTTSRSSAPRNGGSEGSTTPGSSYRVSPPVENDAATATTTATAAERIKITRKSHRKSRLGCRNCKTRRIKCDEDKPQCGNCKRLRVRCDYTSLIGSLPGSSSNNATTGTTSCSSSISSTTLPISEIELAYHWSTSTYQSLSAWNSGALKWRSAMQDIALDHPHVLQLMLALTSLHLAHCRPARREEYTSRSDHFYSQALPTLTSELASVTPSNYQAVVTSVQLLCFVGLGRGPQPGEYLAFSSASDKPRSEWLILFRGVRTTREMSACDTSTKLKLPGTVSKSRPLPEISDPPDFERQLVDLRSHVSFTLAPSPSPSTSSPDSPDPSTDPFALQKSAIYAVDVLLDVYRGRYSGQEGEYHVAFAWLYRMEDIFLERLQARDPLFLIIYAHFAVLLKDMERFWYMRGWTWHVMEGIWNALPEEQRPWVGWPVEQVGWIPP